MDNFFLRWFFLLAVRCQCTDADAPRVGTNLPSQPRSRIRAFPTDSDLLRGTQVIDDGAPTNRSGGSCGQCFDARENHLAPEVPYPGTS